MQDENNIDYKHKLADCIVKDKYFIENLENFKDIDIRKAYFDVISKWIQKDHPNTDIKEVLTKVYGYMVFHSIIPKVYEAEIKALCKGFYKHGRPILGNELTDEERRVRKNARAKEYYRRNREAVCLKAKEKYDLEKQMG